MTQDVRQWLDEIKRLKQQLAEVQQERDAAIERADQWSQRYNVEAQQRRLEAQRYQETISALKTEIERLQRLTPPLANEFQVRVAVRQELEQLKSLDDLKAKLIEVTLDRDRARERVNQLAEALEEEKAVHLKTRNSLTTALGDTVDLLTKAQGRSSIKTEYLQLVEEYGSEPTQPDASASTPRPLPESTQQPLPQLPPLNYPSQGDE